MAKLVSVVIINRNKAGLLKKCLAAVFNQTYTDVEVILVDNASDDGSVEMACNDFPNVRIVQNASNMLVAKSYNQGIALSNGEYILCINNDVFLNKDYLEKALPKFGINSKIGSISGKILNPQTEKIDSTGQFLTLTRRAYERGYKQVDKNKFKECYIWGVTGACLLCKKEMLDDIKINNEYFDEEYRAYLEDLDLNWRAHNAGWRSYFTPDAVAYHYRGSTGWRNRGRWGYLNLSNEFKFQLIKNRYATIVKNETLSGFIKHIPFIFLYDMYLWIFLLFKSPGFILKFIKDSGWIKKAAAKRIFIRENLRRI